MKPKLLDLFCGAGGAAMGYHSAGFDVVGVDIKPQPHYPFPYCQMDALLAMDLLLGGKRIYDTQGNWWSLNLFDAYHASPPCQKYSKSVKKLARDNHLDLIAPTRQRLISIGRSYIIENVVGSPLINYVQLCGSSFNLRVQRHRWFELNFPILVMSCSHTEYPRKYAPAWNRTTPLRVLSISGGYQTRGNIGSDFLEKHKEAMGIDWDISYKELSEAIPPAYTEYIGKYLMEAIEVTK